MIKIELKEDMNEKRGNKFGQSCKVEFHGKGDVLAAQVKCVLDTFARELPIPVWAAAVDAFLNEQMESEDDND